MPGPGARSDRGARCGRQLPGRRRRPDGPADRRAARGAATRGGPGAPAPGATTLEQLSRAAWSRARRRSCGSSSRATSPVRSRPWRTPWSKIDVGDEVSLRVIDRGVGAITETNVIAGGGLRRGHHRLQRPAAGQGDRAGRPRGRGHPVLLGDLPGDRRDRGGAQGHAQADLRGGRSSGTAEIREIFRSSQGRQHRRLHGDRRRHPPQRARRGCSATARWWPKPRIRRCKRFKDDATEVREGFECGLTLGDYNDIKIGDIIETFEMREKART